MKVYRLGGFAASEENVSKSWKTYRYQWEVWGCELLAGAIPLLSRRGCIAMGQVLGVLGYWFDFRGRPVAHANIALALGHRLTEEQQRLADLELLARTALAFEAEGLISVRDLVHARRLGDLSNDELGRVCAAAKLGVGHKSALRRWV